MIDGEFFASPPVTTDRNLCWLDFPDLILWMAGPQQSLPHLALLILFSSFSLSSQAAQVFWSSPTAGTVFGPGDTLIASWTANSTTTKGQKNSTAAFRLCETGFRDLQNGTTSCGEVVAPLIQQSAGSYITTLQVSNIHYLWRCEMLTG